MANNSNTKVICLGVAYGLCFLQILSALNLGLISGDLKRTLNPLIIRKTSHHSPITINIRPGITKPPKLIPSILPPVPLKSIYAPNLLKLPKVPKLPKLPLIPLIPPILPPIIPKLPLLPLPLLPPLLPNLKKLKPIRVPILGRTKLQKALPSEIKPLRVPKVNTDKKKRIKDKLLKLRRDGVLTTPQLLRLRKVLL